MRENGRIPVNGIRIYYEVHGRADGIPLVLLWRRLDYRNDIRQSAARSCRQPEGDCGRGAGTRPDVGSRPADHVRVFRRRCRGARAAARARTGGHRRFQQRCQRGVAGRHPPSRVGAEGRAAIRSAARPTDRLAPLVAQASSTRWRRSWSAPTSQRRGSADRTVVTPTSWVPIMRANERLMAMPIAIPTTTSRNPLLTTMPRTSAPFAPSAIRMPISCVFCVVE